MAIALDTSSYDSGTAGTTHTLSHTCSGSDRILFYSCLYVGADAITGVTYGGTAMTRVDKVVGTGQGIDMRYLVNPNTGANNIVATTSSSNTLYSQAVSYTGAAQTGQLDAKNKQGPSGSGSSLYTSVTTVADNCWLVGTLNSNSTAMAAGTGTTYRAGVNNSIKLADSNGAKTPAGSYSLGVTCSPNFATASQIVCSIIPAGGAVANTTNFFQFF